MRCTPTLLALALAAACSGAALAAPAKTAVLPIGSVQGTTDHSPYAGETVTIEGAVTADMRDGLGGIFVQDAGDGDANTSDALFVVLPKEQAVQVGQWLRITGTVEEQAAGKSDQGLTTLQAQTVIPAAARPVPVALVLTDVPANWEALEGMQVRIPAGLTVAGQDQLSRYGELTAAFGGRLWQPSEVAAAGSPEQAAVIADNNRRRLRLDDASGKRDPGAVSYLTPDQLLRSGAQLRDVQGIVDQRFDGGYRLQLTAPLSVDAERPQQPPTVAGGLRIAAFNLENYFNGDGKGGGYPTLRGAKTAEQQAAQQAKLITTIGS
ncbi:MAG TPA: nuclease, partial [Stenotrophomonas sp.]